MKHPNKMKTQMNEEQIKVLRYAYLDVRGIVEWYENGQDSFGAQELYKAALLTVEDLQNTFVNELKDLIDEED